MLASMLGISSSNKKMEANQQPRVKRGALLLRPAHPGRRTRPCAPTADGKDVELSYRRGCSGVISNLLVSFSRRAETWGGVALFSPASCGRAAGCRLASPRRGRQQEQLVETPVGGAACPEGTRLIQRLPPVDHHSSTLEQLTVFDRKGAGPGGGGTEEVIWER